MGRSGDDIPVACSRFGVGLSWDPGTSTDVDLQAVAISSAGQVVEAVYYNNMKAFGTGLTHSGDELTGEKSGLDEATWVNFAKLPQNVQIIVFIVACYTGGHLCDVRNGMMHLLEDSYTNDVMQLRLEESDEEVDILGVLLRGEDGGWLYRPVEEPAGDGQHFIDILEPAVGNIVRSIIPGAPRRIKACFAMDKGSLVDLPKTNEIKTVKVGLGWDTGGGGVDLDVSAVLLTEAHAEHTTVFFGNLAAPGVQHSGDNLTGAGSGDDEVITLHLDQLASAVQQVVLIINIYTRGQSFARVRNPYSRVFTDTGDELARYQLSDAGQENGLIVARLLRSPDKIRWSFQAVGQPCSGNTYKDSMRHVQELAAKPPKELQMRQLSSENLGSAAAAPQAAAAAPPALAAAAPPPQPAAKSSLCTVQ
mmetsp:Transcript_30488/g.94877  ORF Transcript_30488/g.94877 Transcript_30488/m.94877 type:complete len:420 (+) Transcript_30488:54-1313(+)